MTTTDKTVQQIDASFTAAIKRDMGPRSWTVVDMPNSGEFFGTRKPVRVAGTIDGHPFDATLLPLGDGTHMVPIKAALRIAIGKGDGESVSVHLRERRG
jgi:hypothetical protein